MRAGSNKKRQEHTSELQETLVVRFQPRFGECWRARRAGQSIRVESTREKNEGGKWRKKLSTDLWTAGGTNGHI